MSTTENVQTEAQTAAIPEVTEESKTYIPPMGKAEFAAQCLRAAWDFVTDGVIDLIEMDLPPEQKKKDIIALMQRLREPHINTVLHTAEFIDNYEYHVRDQRNLDQVVEFILADQIIGIKNNYTALPRGELATRDPATDKDPNWKTTALPLERIFHGEHVPIKFQTNNETGYGWLECLNHQVQNPADPSKVINVQTAVPCIRVKKGFVAPNSVWRWQEITETRLKTHWLQGEDLVRYTPPAAKPAPDANPIEKAPETEGNTNGTNQSDNGNA